MKLYLGNIEIYRKDTNVFLCINENRHYHESSDIHLKMTDFDSKWIKNLLTYSSKNQDNILMLNSENQYYMQLYLFFSLRRRLYYTDIVALSSMEYAPKNLLYHKNVQSFLWNQLCTFMQQNGYFFKIIKSSPFLYEDRPLIPLNKYHLSDFLCPSGIRLLSIIAKRLAIRYSLYIIANFSKRLYLKSITKQLCSKYKNVKYIHSKSQSGCLFFSAYNKNDEKLFIKVGTLHGADLKNEFMICNLLATHTNQRNSYLFPNFDDSSSNLLIFPFVNGCSLNELLSKRNLTTNEVIKLLIFLINTLTDLSKCHIIHRDIHFDNILCCINPKTNIIDSFLLTDFGCAIEKNNEVSNNTIREKRKNQYAGSIYRYSKYSWDDAASAAYVVLQNIDINLIDFKLLNQILSYIGQNNYTL